MKKTPRNIAILLILGLGIGGALGVSVALQEEPKERIVQSDMIFGGTETAIESVVAPEPVVTEPVTKPYIANKDGSVFLDLDKFITNMNEIYNDETLNNRQRFAKITKLDATWEDKKVMVFATFDDFNRSDAVFKYKTKWFDVKCIDVSSDNEISNLTPDSKVWITGDFVKFRFDVELADCELKK